MFRIQDFFLNATDHKINQSGVIQVTKSENQKEIKMGTSQSSLAKSSSKDETEHEKTIGVRGHEMESETTSMILIEANENVDSDDVIGELSDQSEEETDDDSEDEEGKVFKVLFYNHITLETTSNLITLTFIKKTLNLKEFSMS